MDFLEEKIKGQKEPYSAALLSLERQISLEESEDLLTKYYEKNSSSTDVSYKQTTVVDNKTLVRIVSKTELNENAQSTKIYAISLERAADPAILGDITKRYRETLLKLRIGELKTSGLIVNPLLENDFSICSQVGHLYSKKSESNAAATAPPSAVDKKPPIKNAAVGKVQGQNAAKPNEQNPQTELTSQSVANPEKTAEKRKPEVKKEVNKPAPSKKDSKKGTAFPFQKIEKSEALKTSAFSRKALSVPVSEKVVISEPQDDEDENLDEESDLKRPKLNRDEELKKLENQLWSDNKTAPDTFQSDPEEESFKSDPEPEPEAEMEAEMEAETEENPDPVVGSEETSEKMLVDDDETAQAQHSSEEMEVDTPESGANSKKPETVRVQRTREVEDEFGFKQSITEWVDVPNSETHGDPVEKSKSSNETLETKNDTSTINNATVGKNSVDNSASKSGSITLSKPNSHKEPESAKPASTTKNPTKKKQGSLMNFFKPKSAK